MNGLSNVPIANLIHLSFHSRHMHDLSFVCPIACTNQYMYSFSPHTIVSLECMLALAVRYFMHPLLLGINFIVTPQVEKKV